MSENMTETVSAYVVSTKFEDLDDFTISRLKVRLLDGIGCIAIGTGAPMCDELFDLVKGYEDPENGATAFFRGKKLAASEAAFVNSFEMRSWDFEAVQCENKGKLCSAGHISGTTVPTALAAAERVGASGKDFITALALGDDVTARLGASSGFNVYAGWDNTNTINGLGATTIVGKLSGLDEKQMRNAYGIDLNTLGSSMDNVNDKTVAFKFPMAFAARNAFLSVDLAKRGLTAAYDAFGGKKGYFFLFCGDAQKPELLCEDLGKVFYADIVIKPWSSCRVTHPYIDATMEIVKKHNPDPAKIAKIVAHTTPKTAAGFCCTPWEVTEDFQPSAAFSIFFTVACALAKHDVRPENMATLEAVKDPVIAELIEKIEISPSLPPDEYVSGNVEVIMEDGSVYFARSENVKGNIYHNPMTDEEILDKFYKNVAGKLTREQADKVIETVNRLEELESITELTDLLA
ncbi:MAG: MmgE/PrpD family protein [Eggerthellaceae bacterium]|nr:MmgE/PrpD family protein [Eggerthellaceae bacterium]